MSTYEIAAPNGKTYRIEGPAGASDEQVRSEVMRQFPGADKRAPAKPAPKPKSMLRQFGENLVSDIGGVAEGVAGLVDIPVQGAKAAYGLARLGGARAEEFGRRLVGDEEGARQTRTLADAEARHWSGQPTLAGTIRKAIPVSTNPGGEMARNISGALGSVGTGMGVGGYLAKSAGPVARGVGQILTSAPRQQAAAAIAGPVAGETAKQMGAGPIGQTVANVAGSIAGAGVMGTVERIGRAATAPRVTSPILAEAQQTGVPVMTSDIRPPKTYVGRLAQATGEKIPITGTSGPRQAQQQSRIEAVRGVLREFGADDAAAASDDVMTDLARKRSALLSQHSTVKQGVIDRLPGAVPVSRTVQAIDSEIAKLEGLRSDEYKPVIAKLEDWKRSIQGQNLQNVELLRKQFGESFKAPELASIRGIGEKALTNIYGPLREDMGAFIKATGKPADFSRWKGANDALAAMAGDIKRGTLKSVLQSGDATPEVVNRMLFSAKPSEVRKLYNGLSATGKARAQTAILQRAAEKAGGIENISPDKFANEIQRLGKSVGVFFSGPELQRIQGLQRVLDITKRAGRAGVVPETGAQLALPGLVAGLTQFIGSAFGGLAAAGGVGAAARLYESAPVRNILINLSKAKAGSAQEVILINRLAEIVKKDAPIPQALNDNYGQSMAASEEEQE